MQMPKSTAPELLRCAQKDEGYIEGINRCATDLAAAIFGRQAESWSPHIKMATETAYYSLTTLAGKQTLGEEYCDLIQLHKSLPTTRRRRLVMIALQLYLQPLINFLLVKSRHSVRINKNAVWKKRFKIVRQVYNDMFPHFDSIHMAVFYLYGVYYLFSKRLMRVQYSLIRKRVPGMQDVGYEILAILILTQMLFTYVSPLKPKEDVRRDIDAQPIAVRSEHKCILCLEQLFYPACTPCGHVFCWHCIMEWCTTKNECPLCRQDVAHQEIYPVYYF